MTTNDGLQNLSHSTTCPSCGRTTLFKSETSPLFCPACGSRLENSKSETSSDEQPNNNHIAFIPGHEPEKGQVQFAIGPYQVVKSIGKGGMGEVLLAYDTVCGRRIALKRIRPDLLGHRQIENRFLKEARVTSQLTHPAIIPIYSIHSEADATYYTMPFVEGETLKQILRNARQQEKKGLKPEQSGASIPALIRIFLSICQAVAYSHSKFVLHRDLKPENIIIGKYGEVQILDWGLAKMLSAPELIQEGDEIEVTTNAPHHLTRIGKVVGTVNYMSPERALGQPSTRENDIYSLGVILYQLLTLQLPFHRGTLKQFRENSGKEVIPDPIEIAPYRDIPKILANIALKCLARDPNSRYRTVDKLIHDLENYIEGRSEWFKISSLNIDNKSDWEFQENILIAEHTAIMRTAEISEWVNLMVSKASFAETIKIETEVLFEERSHGIGILFNIPEASEREQINDGYCLWIATDLSRSTKLLRSSIEVLNLPDVYIKRGTPHKITIEKVDNTIRFSIDGEEQFSYISRMPLVGTHVGLLTRDSHFKLKPLDVFLGSQNIMVNCLAIPDAFLANKDYHQALSEYRRIGYAFPGRAEGREAILRAGITLLEEAKSTKKPELFDAALEEFEKLHSTAGAPLQYLGKALVYEALNDIEEEIKCFELAYRRYPKHPLLHRLQEQALFRLMECSQNDRKAAYHFLLLTLTHINDAAEIPAVQKLISYLKMHWENLDFMLTAENFPKQELITTLAFWLHKNYALEERLHHLWRLKEYPLIPISNALMSLLLLDEKAIVQKLLSELPKSTFQEHLQFIEPLIEPHIDHAFQQLFKLDASDIRFHGLALSLIDRALDEKRGDLVDAFFTKYPSTSNKGLLERKIWSLLLRRRFDEAGELLGKITIEELSKETNLMHFLYGCWLYATEGPEIADIHWSSVLEVPFPRTISLAAHYLIGKLDPGWFKNAFDWERWQLQRQLALFDIIKAKDSP